MKKMYMNKVFFSDVKEIAKKIGISAHELWDSIGHTFPPHYCGDKGFYTYEYILLRKICQILPTTLVRKALGKPGYMPIAIFS